MRAATLSLLLLTAAPVAAGDWLLGRDTVACDVVETEALCDAARESPLGFGGPCGSRTRLTGDWGGRRDELAGSGITLDVDSVLIGQGVASGGLRQRFRFGGHNDYVLNADLGKLGLSQGTFLKVRGETQFGETINPDGGALLVPAAPFLFPAPNEDVTALTNLVVTQFFSESFAVFVGKIDTLDGDRNAYAHGRGKTQFLGTAFVINPVAFRTVPYSTYSVGALLLDDGATYTLQVYDPREYATRNDLDELFSEGAGIAGEARVPVTIGDRPGHHLFGFSWSSRTYVSTNQDGRFADILLNGAAPNDVAGSWSVYYNFDQALVVDPCDENRHWGVFGRFGYADPDASPLETLVSLGIGGASPIRSRPADTFGLGWSHVINSDNLPGIVLGDHGNSAEFFYNVAVSPWFHVTADLQFLWPSRRDVANTVVPGLRAVVDF